MTKLIFILILSALLLSGCANVKTTTHKKINTTIATNQVQNRQPTAYFDWFEYSGSDPVFETPLESDEYLNPIIAGFHPDPSVVVVGEDFYMVHSTFGFFPGLPIFHSRDLVNWTQIGNVIDRKDMMSFDGVHLSRGGIYAPTIEYHNGLFYVSTTCVQCGGNFIVTAKDPAGPWSAPTWLPHVPGIDPSLLFDDDGKLYIVHHAGPLEPSLYDGHKGIWIMEIDPETFAPRSKSVNLINGGFDISEKPGYVEGPHLYKIDGTYYLSAPEGGTGYYHRQTIYKSDNPFGPFEGYPDNPILTQLGLPDDRPNPVTATGHADMFQDQTGQWWAVFLATRVYDLVTPPQDPGNFHTGRETFMLPVTWKDGWPIILEKGKAVPYVVKRPTLPYSKKSKIPTTGNFTLREDFSNEELPHYWMTMRTPQSTWWKIEEGKMHIQARSDGLGDKAQPSFLGRRLQHINSTTTLAMNFNPDNPTQEAGIAAVQSDGFYYTFGLSKAENGNTVVRIRHRNGTDQANLGSIIEEKSLSIATNNTVYLRISIKEDKIDFSYSINNLDFSYIKRGADSKTLTSAKATGFVGALIGMYAKSE